MATNNRVVLFQLGTLCFVLLMLMPAAHGKKSSGVLVKLYGTARCKNNPSRTIDNAALQVSINGTMVATSKTSSSGQFWLVANVTSSQLVALMRKDLAITATLGACGGAADDADVEIIDLQITMTTLDYDVCDFFSQVVDDTSLMNSSSAGPDDLRAMVRERIMPFLGQDSESIGLFSKSKLEDCLAEIMDFNIGMNHEHVRSH